MTTVKAAPAAPSSAPVVLRFGRQDVEKLVGPLSRSGAWHLVEERASRFNQLARRFGVRISTRREVFELAVAARDAAGLEKFQAELQSRPGKIQRALADLLARELGGISAPEPFRRLHDRQRAELSAALDTSLSALRGLGPLMRSHAIAAPFRAEGAPAAAGALETALAVLRGREPRSVAVLGGSGAGKTTLLYRAFEALGEEARSGAPVVALSASKLRWKEAGGLDWAQVLPPDQRGMAERFEALFADGKLTILLDALDEARPLLDWQLPAAASFWAQAARNRCLLSCRELYFQRHILRSPLRRLFGDKLATVTLLDWSAAHAAKLYARLAAAPEAEPVLPGVSALARFSPQFLEGKLKGIRLSAFFAWAFAAFFCRVRKASFPRSEFEMLDYELELVCAWERERLAGELPEDMTDGLLLRLGWACYKSGEDGSMGQDAWIRLSELMDILRRDYPFHAEKGQRFFDALTRLPIVRFDGAHASLRMGRGMAELLAAKHLLALASCEDARQLSEAFETPLFETASRLLYQGIGALDADGRGRFFRTASRAFAEARERLRRAPSRGAVTAMQGLLQPISKTELPEAADWLRRLLRKPEELPGPVLVSLGRALSYLGDREGVDAYLSHLRSSAEARKANRGFYLYWLKDGVSDSPDGPDYLNKVKAAAWPATAGWLAAKLTAPDARPLRRVQLFAFLDLWSALGAPAVPKGELRRVLESLEAEDRASGQLSRELKELRAKMSGGKR